VLRTLGAATASATDCLTVVGWHKRAIKLCGGSDEPPRRRCLFYLR